MANRTRRTNYSERAGRHGRTDDHQDWGARRERDFQSQRSASLPVSCFQQGPEMRSSYGSGQILDLDVFIGLVHDPDGVTLRLARFTGKLENLLQGLMTDSQSVKLLKILQVVAKSELHRESGLKILQTVCNSRFLDYELPALIKRLQSCRDAQIASDTGYTSARIIEMILQLIQQIAYRLPSFASKGSLLLTYLEGVQGVMSVVRSARLSLEEDLKQLKQVCEERTAMVQSAGRRRERVRTLNKEDDVPPEDFVTLPIFPARGDMDFSEKPFLRANKKRGAFKDQCHYLDVQFRLLREDYIRPFRVGLHEFRQMREKGETPKKCQDVRFYYKVRVASIVCKETLQHRLQFDNTRLKYVKWHTSKRLQFGCLVCLSQDDFETMYFAVVTKREVADLQNGVVQVAFEDGLEEILETSPDDEFTMAETTAFFEASRHVLEGLKEIKQEFPMMRYIVNCHSDVKPPKYLDAQQSKPMNLKSLLREGSHFDASAVRVLIQRNWPALEETGFNESQLEAVKTALTKELALIKGPPGTGKTYVGLKIMQVLLDNAHVWNEKDTRRPILVVCYTNHALDQFLEGILEFCPEGIIRVGSRSKNELLERFNLTNIRQKASENLDFTSGRGPSSDTLEACVRARDRSFRDLKRLGLNVDMDASEIDDVRKGVIQIDHLLEVMHKPLTENFRTLPRSKQRSMVSDWLLFGSATRTYNEGSDLYTLLAQEVTSLIQNGRDKQELNTVITAENVGKVPMAVRAQRYRLWLKKLAVAQARENQKTPKDGACSLSATTSREILSDADLKSSVDPGELSAITNFVLKNLEREKNFLICAWLGVDALSVDVTHQFLCTDKADVCTEDDVSPESVLLLSRKDRAQLYRLWLKKAESYYDDAKNTKWRLKSAIQSTKKQLRKGMATDDVLKPVVNSRLFAAIEDHMKEELDVQKQHCVRAWLGIRDFCRDPLKLEEVYKELVANSQVLGAVAGVEKASKAGRDDTPGQREESDDRQVEDDEDDMPFPREQSAHHAALSGDSDEEDKEEEDTWSVPESLRKILRKKFQHLLKTTKPMTEEEVGAVVSFWDSNLTMVDRVRLYLYWVQKYRPSLQKNLQKAAAKFVQESKCYQELKLAVDCKLLQRAKVIGMTTTGAARYRKVLSKVGCPIVMIEEAAEVFEAHVVTTLNQSCQHLILIGDHQQLRPSPTVYDLCRNYQLDLSLFERLVNNNLHHSTLAVQHRMRPEIGEYVRHVYPELVDHPSTLNRPHIQGMKENVFFLQHEAPETAHDETNSRSNLHEARLCVGLCKYLWNQGYDQRAITILTAYTGQVLLLKNNMPHALNGVRVTSVDNYQGEENDVIILSLVRNNEEGTVGFLGTDNRVCVAISRAKCGFYAFGNFRLLAQNSKLWRKIVDTAKENEQIDEILVLCCVNHPDRQLHVKRPEDFEKAPWGGCQLPCETILDCGHQCERLCHGYDLDHQEYRCEKKCERQVCDQNLHPCPKLCWEECGKCHATVQKTVPGCGHTQTVPCSTDPSTFPCRFVCEKALPCDHQCGRECGQCQYEEHHKEICNVEMERTLPCGHVAKMACYEEPGDVVCKIPCTVTLECGHKCPGNCNDCLSGRVHVPCKATCEKPLPGCEHKCPSPCGKTCEPCKQMCEKVFPCKHRSCFHECKEPCPPCTEPCPWSCIHTKCEEICSDPCEQCTEKCERNLPCGHPCRAKCGEECFCSDCEEDRLVPLTADGYILEGARIKDAGRTSMIKLPSCGHIFLTLDLDTYVFSRMDSQLFDVSKLTCPACPAPLRVDAIWRYYRVLPEHHAVQQIAKETRRKASRDKHVKISRHSIQRSFEKVPEVATLHGNFACVDVDMLKADQRFAVANQCKMITTAAGVADLLHTFGILGNGEVVSEGKRAIHDELIRFVTTVLPSVPYLTEQRCLELTEESRRLAYWALMVCASAQLARDEEEIQKVDACIQVLRGKAVPEIPTAEMEGVLILCRQRCTDWDTKIAKSINLKMLEASFGEGLCEFDVPDISAGEAVILKEAKHRQAQKDSAEPTSGGLSYSATVTKPRSTTRNAGSATAHAASRSNSGGGTERHYRKAGGPREFTFAGLRASANETDSAFQFRGGFGRGRRSDRYGGPPRF